MPNRRAYNAEMGSISAGQVDAHLCAGGTVVAASARAARALVSAFHRARRAEGREAWLAPQVMDWQSFSRRAWEERATDLRLPLNPLQEQSLWEQVIRESGHAAAILEGPRRNLAAMAMQAHGLLCSYAPHFLDVKARASWDQDAAAFSGWLAVFDAKCHDERVVSPSLLALEAIPLLAADSVPRPALLLAGFDRLLPVQQELFNAWGEWSRVPANHAAEALQFFIAPDATTELSACAAWCSRRLSARPQDRLLVIAQDVRKRRGEFDRAFLHEAAVNPAFRFEFSLGVPLSHTALVRSTLMLLRWLQGELAEHEFDWLFSTPYAAAPPERAALQAAMRALRNRGLQRTRLKLKTFLDERVSSSLLPAAWVQRMRSAQSRLNEHAHHSLSPTAWAEVIPNLLQLMAWRGTTGLSSAEFQVTQRWQRALDSCGSLGFDGRRLAWREFLSELDRVADETLFAAESEDAPLLVAGPAESAGTSADAIWFLGADENAWPAHAERHPLLPLEVQRLANMPHSSPQADWDLARATTERLLASAPEVIFSFAQSSEGVEARASRIVVQLAGNPQALPRELLPADAPAMLCSTCDDVAAIPYTSAAEGGPIHPGGGAGLLTAQSQCAFKAFASGRLGASHCDRAQDALTPAERGYLLHEVLHSVWGGPPQGIQSRGDLLKILDLEQFVAHHVQTALTSRQLSRIREDMPVRYLELEAVRLARLVVEWLNYERTRIDFEVAGTEVKATRIIAGLSLDLRLDRLDRLSDQSFLVVDYKTGTVSPNSWELPRPEDVQLPLYAGFGLDEGERAGGLVFAKVRPGNMCFAGRVGDARATLDSSLNNTSVLVKSPLQAEDLMDWREAIEKLAADFINGRADVDPLDPVKTCDRCGLQTLCRIQERISINEESEDEEGADE